MREVLATRSGIIALGTVGETPDLRIQVSYRLFFKNVYENPEKNRIEAKFIPPGVGGEAHTIECVLERYHAHCDVTPQELLIPGNGAIEFTCFSGDVPLKTVKVDTYVAEKEGKDDTAE